MAMAGAEVQNVCVLLKHYITRSPVVSDMEVTTARIRLSLQDPHAPDVLVKNLLVSPDPYMRNRMLDLKSSYIPSFVPGEVRISIHPL
jgi:NADPH-dependent curcumin reductase CurA